MKRNYLHLVFLLGMGRNDKFIYKNGHLYDLNGTILYSWNIQNEEIRPSVSIR